LAQKSTTEEKWNGYQKVQFSQDGELFDFSPEALVMFLLDLFQH